jgi:hypothetical protein
MRCFPTGPNPDHQENIFAVDDACLRATFFDLTGPTFKDSEMANIKTSVDTATAYKLHRLALAEGRSVSAVVRAILDREMATAAVQTPALETHDVGDKRVVGAYLSGPLANAIESITRETGRSKSHVLRALVRDGLRARGLLPTSKTEPAAATVAS